VRVAEVSVDAPNSIVLGVAIDTRLEIEIIMGTTNSDFETVRLLKFEGMQLRATPITRVTFYEGRPPLEYIRDRLSAIVTENAWLQGRLVKQEGRLVLRYPKTASGIAKSLRVMDFPGLSFDMGFAELAAALEGAIIKRGAFCVGKDEDLFRVTVARVADGRFAVVMSMSHVYADTPTFYEIHKMLSTAEKVRPLIVERVYSSNRDMNAMCGGQVDAIPWLTSPGFVVNVTGTLIRRRKPTVNLFQVDRRKIDERKKEYESGNKPKFITTNDIITAEFFSKTACDLMFMSINVRNRIPHLTSDHAGNYACLIACQREDFARPELIRVALSQYRRAMSGELPGFFRSTRVKLGAVSNSATLYRTVELPESRLLFHRPVLDTATFFPFEFALFIFKSDEAEVSLVTCCKETSGLAKMDILREQVV
jgi:hypothetical protein